MASGCDIPQPNTMAGEMGRNAPSPRLFLFLDPDTEALDPANQQLWLCVFQQAAKIDGKLISEREDWCWWRTGTTL